MSFPELENLLRAFPPISLEEMKAVKLMNRIDTKYLVAKWQLPDVLAALQSRYYVQTKGEKQVIHYNTLYYDTPDVQMYLAHHNRKLTRQKLRARIYCDTQDAFCEIKNKNNKKRTKKKRMDLPLADFSNMMGNPSVREFVQEKLHYDVGVLIPQVENEFDRITLVNMEKTERLTIDTNIVFHNHATGMSAAVPDLVIIELKQDGNMSSYFKSVLLNLRIHPKRISKYCLGTILTRPEVKMNRFKRKLTYIRKLSEREQVIKK